MTPTASERLSDQELTSAFDVMCVVREFETAVARAFRAGEIPGVVHVSLMQEATAGAISLVTGPGDALFSTHRGHGHCIARGVSLVSLWAELLGRREGASGGRGGSMHIFSPRHGVMGTNGIVGANVPLAVGHSLATRLKVRDGITLAVFGEGATGTGAFHEAVQLASLWRAPVVLVCENNGFSEFTDFERWATFDSVADLAGRYRNLTVTQCNGRDVEESTAALAEAVAVARSGRPALLETFTSRGSGHYEGDAQAYRAAVETEDPDPLTIARAALRARDVADEALDALVEAAISAVEEARQAALAMDEPSADTLLDHVYA
jgi:pyruvate dehydrogenase E1 component alpha subunit